MITAMMTCAAVRGIVPEVPRGAERNELVGYALGGNSPLGVAAFVVAPPPQADRVASRGCVSQPHAPALHKALAQRPVATAPPRPFVGSVSLLRDCAASKRARRRRTGLIAQGASPAVLWCSRVLLWRPCSRVLLTLMYGWQVFNRSVWSCRTTVRVGSARLSGRAVRIHWAS